MDTRRMSARWVPGLLVALWLVAGWLPVAAADDDAPVQLQLLMIRATASNDDVDRELRPLAKELQKRFRLTGFKLLKQEEKKVPLEKTLKLKLSDVYSIELTPLGRERDKVVVGVKLLEARAADDKPKGGDAAGAGRAKPEPKKLLDTKLKLTPARFFLFGGLKFGRADTARGAAESEDVLILALAAK